MSIPKEPRQLMINLMYLVLTALLALNVSAEVLNAFLEMDSSLMATSNVVGATNKRMADAIHQHADAYPKFGAFKEKVESLKEITEPFYEQVETLKKDLIEQSGGFDENEKLKGVRDKNATTRIFVNEGKGDELKDNFFKTRKELFALIDDQSDKNRIEKSLPTRVGEFPEDSDKKSWAAFTFQQMPMAATLPLLTKFKNDIQVAETAILNHFFSKMNVEDKVDAYVPVVAANKSYVIRGEEYSSEIFLASYNSSVENVKVRVDGRSLKVVDGKAQFIANPNSTGERRHKLEMEITNPLTGEIQTFRKDFSYEVGERSATVSADKMNVFYMGVENPISISVAGVASGDIKIKGKNVNLTKVSGGKYIAKPKKTSTAKVILSGGNLKPTEFEYRVKNIPDPICQLGKKTGGTMTAAEMRVQPGVIPFLKDFEFDAKCNIIEFYMARVDKNGDVAYTTNKGGRFDSKAKRIVEKAKRGDTYFFNEVRVKCPGDTRTREIPGMVFSIK